MRLLYQPPSVSRRPAKAVKESVLVIDTSQPRQVVAVADFETWNLVAANSINPLQRR
jgi:hypothetical protein